MSEPLKCKCCGGDLAPYCDSFWKYFSIDWTLHKCSNCCSIVTGPTPNEATINELYKNSFNYEWYEHHIDFKRTDAIERFKELKSSLSGPLLDYGGGLGYFAEECARNGVEALTYDPFAGNDLESLADQEWNAITLFHVLEHLRDPNQFFLDVDRVLVDGGRLIITVPNAKSIGMLIRGVRWVWFQPPLIHLNHFTEEGLSALLIKHGYRIDSFCCNDRWDANFITDIVFSPKTELMERDWGLTQDTERRKEIAYRNGKRRLKHLSLCRCFVPRSLRNSEITVTATKLS